MKRFVQALVMLETIVATAVIAIAGLCGLARAESAQPAPTEQPASPVVKIKARAWPSRVSTADGTVVAAPKFRVAATFSTDPPGAQLFTVQKFVIFLPDHAGTNGRLFPSCSAKQIRRFHGNTGRCPKGSQIGTGTLSARAIELGITSHGRVAMFNGPRGKSITLNIQTLHPAAINESIDAPLEQLHGTYGEKLTHVIPHSLQEIIPGIFVGVQSFDVVIGGAVIVNGVTYPYLRARTCPKRAMHGVFDFENWTIGQTATVTTDTKVRCTIG